MQAPRTFVFYHGALTPFSLRDLRDGEARYGGGVARLRLLFWLAARGHSVRIAGNVEPGACDGVGALPARDLSALPPPSPGTTFVFNDPPSERDWATWSASRWPGVHSVLWAGTHFERKWMDRLARRELDRIVCVSRWHRDSYRIFRGFERIEASYSGIDRDFLAPRIMSEPDTVLSLSVPRASKGFGRLLSAWHLVRARRPSARLLVSGAASMHDPSAPLGRTGILDAGLEAEFPDLFGEAGSLERAGIELLGSRSLPEVHGILARVACAVVNPSHTVPETYCRAAVEAQATGVAVVGARYGALPEVVADGRTGLLYRDDSPEALADAILRLLNDPELAADMGRAGVAWSNWLADYALIAPDWEGIAERAESDAPAPSDPRPFEDRLREVGYGSARNLVSSALSSRARGLLVRTMRGS